MAYPMTTLAQLAGTGNQPRTNTGFGGGWMGGPGSGGATGATGGMAPPMTQPGMPRPPMSTDTFGSGGQPSGGQSFGGPKPAFGGGFGGFGGGQLGGFGMSNTRGLNRGNVVAPPQVQTPAPAPNLAGIRPNPNDADPMFAQRSQDLANTNQAAFGASGAAMNMTHGGIAGTPWGQQWSAQPDSAITAEINRLYGVLGDPNGDPQAQAVAHAQFGALQQMLNSRAGPDTMMGRLNAQMAQNQTNPFGQ